MAELTAKERRDILMFRALNYTYDEIAAAVNDRNGGDVTSSAVGTFVRARETEAREGGPHAAFDEIVVHGYVSDLLGE